MMRVLILLTLIAQVVAAKDLAKTRVPPELDPPLRAGTLVSVNKFDSTAQVYDLGIVGEEGVGPNIATPEDLAKAIKTIEISKLKKSPTSIVGNQYQLDSELRLLSELGVKKRKKSLKK